jgi:hypothetical protein
MDWIRLVAKFAPVRPVQQVLWGELSTGDKTDTADVHIHPD